MERIISIFMNPETEAWFGGLGMPLIIELLKFVCKRRENQKRRKKLSRTVENDIFEITKLITQKRISFNELQQEYFRYFNKYKCFLAQAEIEMLIRKEFASKEEMKKQLSTLIGLLEALQLNDYI